MKREQVSYILNHLTSGVHALTGGRAFDFRSNTESMPMIDAVQKLQMTVLAKYLTGLLQRLKKSNFELSDDATLNHEWMELYEDVFRSIYNQVDRNGNTSFQQFWEQLVQEKGIPQETLKNYEYAKMQTYILWLAMMHFIQVGAMNPDTYMVNPDVIDDGVAYTNNCGNTVLERVIQIIDDYKYYFPVKPEWKGSKKKAILTCPEYKGDYKRGHPNFRQIGNKTLGDLQNDFNILQFFRLKHASFYLPVILGDLAQAMAELQSEILQITAIICSEKDFNGMTWEVGELALDDLAKSEALISLVNHIAQSQRLPDAPPSFQIAIEAGYLERITSGYKMIGCSSLPKLFENWYDLIDLKGIEMPTDAVLAKSLINPRTGNYYTRSKINQAKQQARANL